MMLNASSQVGEKDRLIDLRRASGIFADACHWSGTRLDLSARQLQAIVLATALIRQLGLDDVYEAERRTQRQLIEYGIVLPDEVWALLGPMLAHGAQWCSPVELKEIFAEGLREIGW